jgi:hypothetical protein
MLVVAAGVVVVVEVVGNTKKAAPKTPATGVLKKAPVTTLKPVPPPLVHSALRVPLPVPIAEPLVLPGTAGALLIVGGETADGGSGSGAFLMNTSTGALRLATDLAAAVHDASGATLGHEDFVFGGKAASVTSSVQSFGAPTGSTTPATALSSTSTSALSPTTTVASATATGALPQPRAGSVAVTIGATVYIVGGFHGTTADADVLATSDGGTFTTVAKLPVPVRNPAVAVSGGDIYVFGGSRFGPVAAGSPVHAGSTGKTAPGTKATTPAAGVKSTSVKSTGKANAVPGPSTSTSRPGTSTAGRASTWSAVAVIQQVDPVTGRSVVVGHLPRPLQGAVAINLAGFVYVAGGQGPGGVNGTIWGFEPPTGALVAAGVLKVPVSVAGVVAVGTTAWLVGGEVADGRTVGSVQVFRPEVSPPALPATGLSQSTATTKTSPARAG